MERKVMTGLDPFDLLLQKREDEGERAHRLAWLARQWDGIIRDGLQRLGQVLWGADYLLGLIPRHRYRVRYQGSPKVYVWRVEHDIPPYDRYRCAAYQVQLTLDDRDEPVLTVNSGEAIYPVTPLTSETLRMALATASQEDPLVIPRNMGEATDL